MKKFSTIIFLLFCLAGAAFAQQDGDNTLWGVPTISKTYSDVDSVLDGGRSIFFVPGPNSLDNDNLADILVVDYKDGGKILVFEQVNQTSLDFKLVWRSKPLKKNYLGNRIEKSSTNVTPRAVIVGDIDGNGRKEIIFTQGRLPSDTITSDTTFRRGIYFYEWTGKDNDYGTEPFVYPIEKIDSFSRYYNFGRLGVGGLVATDVDGDGKQELLVGTFDFAYNDDLRKNSSKVYVLSAKSGSIANKDLVLDTEYVYHGMARAKGGTDGYICSGIKVADIDGDGRNEIVVVGQTITGSGGGLGVFKSTGPNKYMDGNVIDLTDAKNENLFNVQSELGSFRNNGADIIFFNTDEAPAVSSSTGRIIMLSDVIDVQLLGANNLSVLKQGRFGYVGTDVGDQDHSGSGKDGFDIYYPSADVQRIYDLEYKGTGNLADSNNYTQYEIFNAKSVYKTGYGGIYQIIVPPNDINGDGRKKLLANFQEYGKDTLVNGNVPMYLPSPFFVLEWGDKKFGTLEAKPLKMIMPEDYKLEQNYPNPFNPTTTIKFTLPASENLSMIIYDINGKEVKKLIDNKYFDQGSYEVTWDAKDNYNRSVASGVYLYKMVWGNFEKSSKMTLLK